MVILSFLAAAPPSLAADTFVTLVSSQNGMCLQPINGSSNLGDAIVQEPCNGSATQLWQVIAISSGVVHFINSTSHLCLDARGGAANGTPVQQWTCSQITNLNWRTDANSKLLKSAVSNTSSHCITTPGNQAGLQMSLMACANVPAEYWLQGGTGTSGTPCIPTAKHPCP